MRSLFSIILIFVSIQTQAYVGLCCGKCGGNMPMNIPGGGVPETHEFRLKINPVYMHMDGLVDGTDSVSAVSLLGMPVMAGMPTGKYMAVPENMSMSMFNMMAGYSFTDDFFAGIMFMHTDNTMGMKFNSMMSTMTGQSGFTMKSSGISDTMIMTKYRMFTDDPLIPKEQVSLLMGLSLPTGSIDERVSNHPVAMRRDGLLPYGMQLGSGTYDPTIGVLYQASKSPYWWGTNLSYTARLHDNKRDYRLGDEIKLDLYSMYQLRHDFLLQLQLNALDRGEIRGEADESVSGASARVTKNDPSSPFMTPTWDPDYYGKQQVSATVGFQWQPTSLQIIDFSFSKPLYTKSSGPQLEDDYKVMVTWYIELPTKKSRRYSKPSGSLGF